MRNALLATLVVLMSLIAPAASACVAVTATDKETGETYTSGSPEWLRREQAEWRKRSSVVILAQAREGRMVGGNDVEFTLSPVATVYGGELPKGDFRIRWMPGNTCNRFQLTVSSAVIVFVGPDGGIIGHITPDLLQDRPPTLNAEMRKLRTQSIQ
jgi:hypothetical protein